MRAGDINILFVTEADWLDGVVFDIHLFSEALSLKGHTIYAIDYGASGKKKGFSDLGTLKTLEFNNVSRALSGSSVHLIRPGFLKIPFLGRLSAFLTHGWQIRKILREKNIDAVILYSIPTNSLQTVYFARKYGVPVIFRIIDMMHPLLKYPLVGRIIKLIEKSIYSRVDAIESLTPKYAEYTVKLGADKDKIQILRFPIDTGLFHPGVDYSALQKQWGISENDKVIVFVGTLFYFRGLDDIVRLFPEIIEKVPAAKILIIGDGDERAALENTIRENHLEGKVIITGFQPFDTLPGFINMATLCINTFRLDNIIQDVFPAKLIQYMACGKASVATASQGTITAMPSTPHGVAYAKTPEEMKDILIRLLLHPKERKSLERAGLKYVEEAHHYNVVADKLEKTIMSLVKNS